MTKTTTRLLATAMLVLSLVASASLAATKTTGKSKVVTGKYPEKRGATPLTPLPDDQNGTNNAGQTKLDGGDIAAINEAQEAFQAVDTRLKTEFHETVPMKAATAALQSAQQKLTSARQAVVEKLLLNPTYATAKAKRDRAQEKLDALRAADQTAPEQLTRAASEVLDAGSILTKMQSEAERNDPALPAANTALADASSKMADMQKQLETSLAGNPDWAAKKKTLDAARAKFTAK